MCNNKHYNKQLEYIYSIVARNELAENNKPIIQLNCI